MLPTLSDMENMAIACSGFVKSRMGLVRLKIRELAEEKGWTLKDVADRANVPYSTVRHYARSQGLATVDLISCPGTSLTYSLKRCRGGLYQQSLPPTDNLNKPAPTDAIEEQPDMI